MNPVHTFPPHFYKIRFNTIPHLRLGLPNGFFPSGLPTNILYAFLSSPVRATRPHLASLI